MKASLILQTLVLAFFVTGAHAGDTLLVTGTAGYLSEWELNAEVASSGTSRAGGEFSGAVALKHVGLCSTSGPVTKSGNITVRILKPRSAAEIEVTLLIDGTRCRYQGSQLAYSEGFMDCSDGNAIPVKLTTK
jgi:hypothetical protein